MDRDSAVSVPPPTRRPRRVGKHGPDLVAAIDIGTTSVRMQVAELHSDAQPPVIIENLVHPLALAGDTFRHGQIRPETLRALSRVLAGFGQLAKGEYGIADIRCIGTSAIREASNHEIVVDRVAHDSGIHIRVIDAVEESRLTFQLLDPALGEFFDDPRRYSLVLGLGGGVTDLMLLEGRDLAYASSRRLGTARLIHSAWPDAAGAGPAVVETMIRNIIGSALDLYRNYPVSQIVLINSGMAHAARNFPAAAWHAHGAVLEADRAREIVDECLGLASAALAERFSLRLPEAELLEPAFAIVHRIIEIMPTCRWVFADLDTISALVHELARERRGENPRLAFSKQIYRSARSLGARYGFDQAHADHVAETSTVLFMSLSEFLDLAPEELTLLTTSALLHDIGMYVSEHAHHKHSAYLVRWSEIVGLEELERVVASQIVRYHRRAVPAASHEDFMSLMPEKRLQVRKLAALLRIADAIDRGHRQAVRVVRATVGERDLVIDVVANDDLSAERAAMADKSNLFEQVTGLRVQLRPVAGG